MITALVSPVGQVGAHLAEAGVGSFLGGVTSWVLDGARGTVAEVASRVVGADPQVSAAWFGGVWAAMLRLAAACAAPMLVAACIQAVIRQEPALVARAVAWQLPLAGALAVSSVWIVEKGLAAVDGMCAYLVAAVPGGRSLSSALPAAVAGETFPGGQAGGLLAGLVAVVAGFALWLELTVRDVAIYAATLFLPLGLATMVWPAASRLARRLAETVAALVLSKFVIVAVLVLSAAALGGAGPDRTVAGVAMLLVAVAAPFALFRLLTLAELGAIGHLENLGHRSAARVASFAAPGVSAVVAPALADRLVRAPDPEGGTPGPSPYEAGRNLIDAASRPARPHEAADG